jgi:hypothetical protein
MRRLRLQPHCCGLFLPSGLQGRQESSHRGQGEEVNDPLRSIAHLSLRGPLAIYINMQPTPVKHNRTTLLIREGQRRGQLQSAIHNPQSAIRNALSGKSVYDIDTGGRLGDQIPAGGDA